MQPSLESRTADGHARMRRHTGLLTACKVNRQSESRPAGSHHTNSGMGIRFMSTVTHSLSMRLTAESEIPIFQYSDGAAGGARARARVKEGGEEGAHWDWWCGRAA